jgi:hypothetical protein
MPYRLHIDIPLNMTEEEAKIASIQILGLLADHDDKAIILNAMVMMMIVRRAIIS